MREDLVGSARNVLVAVMSISFLSGCATKIKQDDLRFPEKVTCIQVPSDLEAHETRGVFKNNWTTKLVAGPYLAEREDAEGTYYRAPPGGVYIVMDGMAKRPPVAFNPRYFEGGIWVPHAPEMPPQVYVYISMQDAAVVPVSEDVSCASAVYAGAADSKGVSAVGFATGGAVGGAVGGVTARGAAGNSSMSYGQSAGVGAAGGAIGGLIIAGLINMDIGKIVRQPVSNDADFLATLDRLARTAVVVPEAPAPIGNPE